MRTALPPERRRGEDALFQMLKWVSSSHVEIRQAAKTQS